jgi:hypothetical protein
MQAALLANRAPQPSRGYRPRFFTGPMPQQITFGGLLARPSTESLPANRFATVKQTAKRYEGVFTESALRNLIWDAEAYARNPKPGHRSNGFLAVIHRPGGGRKILLDQLALAQWLSDGKHPASAVASSGQGKRHE